MDSLGLPKVEVALRKLSRLNPDVTLDPFPESLTSVNASTVISDVDVVLDGLDRPEPRYLVNRTCHKLKIPYVFGAAIESFGNVSTIVPGHTVCLECFMREVRDEDLPKCGVVGVHPSIIGVVTALQVSEAVNLIVGKEPNLLNKLLYINLREVKFDMLKLAARESCPVCGIRPDGLSAPFPDKFLEETCARDGRRTFIISPKQRIEIDLKQLRALLDKLGFPIKTSGMLGVTFRQSEEITTSILKSGIMVAQTSPTVGSDPKKEVLHAYKSILIDSLGLPQAALHEE
ncbi:MAG: HesA/MoeB/ThiF family protein [Deltaproteobacteria bacterium]|nr:MAG: HesA/MoeB/ThiF family protein [Deltaproteobacteria bacterium]